jgi:hypothetical protein
MQYEQLIAKEFKTWQRKMMSKPSAFDKLSKKLQVKMNSYIPEKIHKGITVAIKQMIRGVLFSAKHITAGASTETTDLQQTEEKVLKRINAYKHTAAAEGGITGAGGFLLALAEFPVLLGIKLKLLFDIASMYGYSVKDYKERIYILHIFQLAFSSHQHRKEVYLEMIDWESKKQKLPDDINEFDWRALQQEYRDYIDLAKMAQLIPGIGAVVGYVVNFRLIKKLGTTAMNAYRMRWFEERRNVAKILPLG